MVAVTNKQDTALRKRQQIAKANRLMFIWVAAASALIGFCLVISVMLVQKLVFNEKVLAEKAKTVSTLQKNNQVISKLEDQIRVLNTNQSLVDTMIPTDKQPVQVILDALPSDANSAAFGASLQQKLIAGDDISIESFTVDPIAGIESSIDSSSSSDPSDSGGNEITFHLTVTTGDPNALKAMLRRLESSIRAIDITALTLNLGTASKYTLDIVGHGYYEPAKQITLQDKAVKP